MNKRTQIMELLKKSSDLVDNGYYTFEQIYRSIMSGNPNIIALIHHESDDVVREYTYGQFNRMTMSIARKLSILLADVRKKDAVVAMKLKNSPAWCFIFWALLMSGYRPILIEARLAKENTDKLLKNSHAVAIISDDMNTYDGLVNLTKDSINDISEDLNFKPNWSNEVIFCSSGTTGDIKLMIFNGENMINQLAASRDMYKETLDIMYPVSSREHLRIAGFIPFHHIFGFVAIFLWYTFYNCTIVFTDFNDPLTIIQDIRNLRVTHIYHVPLFYEVVYKNFINKLDDKQKVKVDTLIKFNLRKENHFRLPMKLIEKTVKKAIFGPQIRYLISGGGSLESTISETINGLGYPLYNGYGMTEVGVTSVELSPLVTERIKRSIGHPLHGVTYKVNKNHELLIKSPITHVKEIINGKEVPAKLDKDGFFATGDIVEVEDNYRYFIVGRSKEVMIASNGENVYPDEIESYFRKIKGVINLASFMYRNKIILVIEAYTDVTKFANEINATLPIHKQPSEIIVTKDPLPLSSSMKVKRFKVRDNYRLGLYGHKKRNKKTDILSGYEKEAKNEVVNRLQKIFQKVLYTNKEIDGNAHWINDLNSDSMTYITLVSEIEKEFVIKFPLEKYGKLTTLNEFAKELLDSSCK